MKEPVKEKKENFVMPQSKRILSSLLAAALLLSGCGSADQPAEDSTPAQSSQEVSEDSKQPSKEQPLSVTVLDVGQGLSVYAQSGDQSLLYDGGDREASSYVVSWLKSHAHTPLDTIICSHYDADHINGVVGALNSVKAEKIFGPDYTTDSRVFTSLQNSIKEDGLELTHPKAGDSFELGQAKVEFLTPLDQIDSSDPNEKSLAVRIRHGNRSVLLTGDLGEEGESALADQYGSSLKSDVYIAGHHGSDGSSTEKFLDCVQPEETIISCGKDNSYGHPGSEALARLEACGSKIYRTDRQGEIAFTIDEDTVTFSLDPLDDPAEGKPVQDKQPEAKEDEQPAQNEQESQTEEPQQAPAEPDPAPAPEPDPAVQPDPAPAAPEADFVINTNTGKIHYPNCPSVARMKESNKAYVHGTLDSFIAQGYEPCKNCMR